MTTRIVCAVDFSQTSSHALEHGARLGRRLGAELHLVHAYGLPMAALPVDGGVMAGPARAAEIADEAQQQMKKWQLLLLQLPPGQGDDQPQICRPFCCCLSPPTPQSRLRRHGLRRS